MQKNRNAIRQMVTLAMLSAILLVLSFTPLGYLNIGPLAISLNMIPVGIAAIALGPWGGMFLGGIFGLTSFLQCVGVGGTSAMGVILFGISPVLAFVQRFVPRVLAGFLTGMVNRGLSKVLGHTAADFASGLCAALFNTVLFMLALILLFGNTQYLRDLIDGRNVLVFVCSFVGVNALVEMLAATLVVGSVGRALRKSSLIGRQ